jgi:putative inorganic carbon (HCO3(-)) transporter
MERPKDVSSSKRGTAFPSIITSKTVLYLLLISLSIIAGFSLLIAPRPEIVPAVAFAVTFGFTFFFYPYLGILAFIILSYMRFEETIPALGNLHLAKLLTVTLIVVWVMRVGISKSKLHLQETGLIVLYFFYLAMALSIPFSFWPTKSFDMFVEMLKILVFTVLLIHLTDTQKKLQTFLWTFLIVNGYLAFTAIRDFVVLGQAAVSTRIGGSGGFLGDANDFALALSVVLPFSLYLFLSEKKLVLKLVYFTLSGLYTLGIISTASRGGFVTLVFIFLYLILKSKHKLVGVVAGLLIFFLILSFAPSEYWQRQMTITSYQQDASAMGRIGAWKAGLRMFLDRPLLGVGVGAYIVAYGVEYGKTSAWFSALNAYIQIASELGIFGILTYLALVFLIFRSNTFLMKMSLEKGNTYLASMSQGIKGALVAYVVGSFFLSVGYYLHLYLLLGMTVILEILSRDPRSGE